MAPFVVRPATLDDLPAMARLAAALVRQHHETDPQRFFMPEDVERGYRWWFERELASATVVLRVAESEGRVVGYTYGRLEERDWNALMDACGALHDIYVDAATRGHGVGAALLTETLDALKALGAPRVILHTMAQNAAAQRLFARAGFRTTMFEMTRES
jgi:ribosomal protein S18 acetylase RimI-like enzyme